MLQPFILDPIISWSRSGKTGGRSAPSTSEASDAEGRKAVGVIDGRLRGIFNLANPNLTKVKRTDVIVKGERGEEADDKMLPLGVEGQCNRLISEATRPENLVRPRARTLSFCFAHPLSCALASLKQVQMYVGWMAWV